MDRHFRLFGWPKSLCGECVEVPGTVPFNIDSDRSLPRHRNRHGFPCVRHGNGWSSRTRRRDEKRLALLCADDPPVYLIGMPRQQGAQCGSCQQRTGGAAS